MAEKNKFTQTDLLIRLGYDESAIKEIKYELDKLFDEIDFDRMKQAIGSAAEAKDTALLISSLKEVMSSLEPRGYYRPDAPMRLIRLLVNGLNLRKDDIFIILERSDIPENDKRNEQELLASCAAITQFGYILTGCILDGVKAASSGPHVFLIWDGFSPGSKIFIDFSIDSIIEIDVQRLFYEKNGFYYLNCLSSSEMDDETFRFFKEYYPFFRVTQGSGLSHNIHNNIGNAYEMVGMYELAVGELTEALRLDPEYIEVHNNLGVVYNKLGDHEKAFQELAEALRLNPGYFEAHLNLGIIQAANGQYTDAMAELSTALRLKPDHAPTHNAFGNTYLMQDEFEKAIDEFQEAIKIDPASVPAHYSLGNIYAEMKRYDEAIFEFQEAIRLRPDFADGYRGIGMIYYEMGKFERSIDAWKKAVFLEPAIFDRVPAAIMLRVRQGIRYRRDK